LASFPPRRRPGSGASPCPPGRRLRIRDTALRGRALVLAVAAGAALASPPQVRAEEYGPDLESYLALVEQYRAGHPEGPVRAAGSWGPSWTRATTKRLIQWCRDTSEGGATARLRVAQGAFLLHTHAALAERELDLRPVDHEAHVAAAYEILRWLRGRWEHDPGAWPPEMAGIRPRDFYLALAAVELVSARHHEARDLATESLENEHPDGEMRLLEGCTWETEALIRRQLQGEWHDGTLRKAESLYREALEDDTTLEAARLRLGWVLVRRGRPHQAQRLLRSVAEGPGSPGRRALAWLFLGAVPAAVGAYREAIRIAPHLQAAQMGLAHALELDSGDDAARAVVRSFFQARSRSWVSEDPWNEYPYGPPELRLRPFEVLVERCCSP
jgi:tetratricopeptide (TPR) repeat protein